MTTTFPEFQDKDAIALALSSRIMELVILPTEDCNFRCTYCFEDHVPGKMQPDTVNGIKRLIERRVADLSFLRISWFGGEPLAAKDVVFEVTEFAHEMCREHGVEFAGDMTTNGYLLSAPVADRLAAVGVNLYFVSLAGLAAEHDRLRPLVSGRGSFERIWANLLALQSTALDFTMSLRLHFSTDIAKCEALCRQVNDQFGGDPRFEASLQRIADLGGANTGKFATVAAEDAHAVVEDLAGLLPDMRVDGVKPKENFICYAARPNNMVVRTDGRISRCVAHLDDSRNTVGILDADGRLHLDQGQYRPWLKGFDGPDGRMLACPYASVPKDLWPTYARPNTFPVKVVSAPRVPVTA